MKYCKAMIFLLLTVAVSFVLGSYSEAYADNDISIEYTLESEVGEIGKPFYVHYSVSGGSGSYSRIRIDGTLIDGDNRVAGDAVFDATEPSGIACIIPYSGNEMVLWQHRINGRIHIGGHAFCENQQDAPCFCSQGRTDSSCQAGPVSQNQIR